MIHGTEFCGKIIIFIKYRTSYERFNRDVTAWPTVDTCTVKFVFFQSTGCAPSEESDHFVRRRVIVVARSDSGDD